MKIDFLLLAPAAALVLVWPPAAGAAAEVLRPGPAEERPIAAGEVHAWSIAVADAPLVVTVEQQGVDLVLEVCDPAGESFSVEATNDRWGPEVVLLDGTGEVAIEVRPRKKSIWPGRYAIRVEPAPEDEARRRALELMNRAGREAFADTPEGRRQAAASCGVAAEAWSALGDRRWEAEARSCLATLEKAMNDYRAAAEDHEQALALWREVGEPRREATTLNDLGVTYYSIGENLRAREVLEGAVALWQGFGERLEEAATRLNLCILDLAAGALPAALACYQEQRPAFQESGVQYYEQFVLNNLGGIYDLLGEPDAALEHYRQALALRRELGERLLEVQSLNNIAAIHDTLGEWQEALRLYGQARELLEPLGDREQEAALLNNVGFTYNNSLGEPQRALAFFEEALRLRREIGDRRRESGVLNNLGTAWRRLGEPQQALAYHRQALELAVALGDARQEAVTRLFLAEVEIEQGDSLASLSDLDRALEVLTASGSRPREAHARQLRGRALTLAGRTCEAPPDLEAALAMRRTLRDRAGEAGVLHDLATAERSLGLTDAARVHAEEAVARAEELRTGFVTPDLRAAFLATQRRAYALLLDLLMDRHAADPAAGWDRAAFEVSERARARSLLDVLDAPTARSGVSAVPAELLERRQALRRRLSAKADQQLRQGDAGAEARGRELDTLLADLDALDAEIHRHDPGAAALSRPQPIGADKAAHLLDSGTILVEYALGEERSFLWTLEAGALRSFILPPRREIEALARRAYEELSTLEAGSADGDAAAEVLGRLLLAPFWERVSGVRRLAVVSDAALHLVPFGALQVPPPGRGWDTPERLPLVEYCEVVDLPSATTLAAQRRRLEGRQPAPKLALVLADPVFAADDPRLGDSAEATGAVPADVPRSAGEALLPAPGFARLRGSRREAEAIAGLAAGGEVRTVFDLAASREAALSGDLAAYRVVHFATHGVADTRNPELSGLVLSLVDGAGNPREGFLGLADIYDLDLGADLVVLSGCRTALGREIRGEGLMSLTRGFVYAGVPRVVATLWPAQDRAAAELMTRFYRAMWQDGLPPAAALRAAQRSLRAEPRYRDPYFWAGFVLQGEWR